MIYTKTGDSGSTSLANGERVSKTDARIAAYGTADELNSFVGLLIAECQAQQQLKTTEILEALHTVQNKLFNLGALLSQAPGEWLTAQDATQVEHWIDTLQAQTSPVHAFVLPVGNRAVGVAHVCRTVTRRLERQMLGLPNACPKEALIFVNRLSDYFFALARYMGEKCDISPEIWAK